MDETLIRANLEVAHRVSVVSDDGRSIEVEIRRLGEWQGSPAVTGVYTVMFTWGRILRWVRRDHRWEVLMGGPEGRPPTVIAETESKHEAIQIAADYVANTPPATVNPCRRSAHPALVFKRRGVHRGQSVPVLSADIIAPA